MKLALPSFSVWLLGFYTGFHCLCNITAELCRYADRQFYKGSEESRFGLGGLCVTKFGGVVLACASDFWNATSLDAFWRLVRHSFYGLGFFSSYLCVDAVEYSCARVVPPPHLHGINALCQGVAFRVVLKYCRALKRPLRCFRCLRQLLRSPRF
jgi:hypothetical protein